MFQASDVAGDVRRSDYQADQLPAYLLPDGTWRFGKNASRIAESAWAFRKSAARVEICDQPAILRPLMDHADS